MKRLFGFLLVLASVSEAKVLSVSIEDIPVTPSGTETALTVEIEACHDSYDTFTTKFSKLSDNAALVEVKPVNICAHPTETMKGIVDIDFDLQDLGLDPKTAKIFVQIR